MTEPAIWKVCDECGGRGWIWHMLKTVEHRCPKCAHSPFPGFLAILYTPEEYEAAGGILHDDLPVFFRPNYIPVAPWVLSRYAYATEAVNMNIIIATPAITREDLEEL